MLAVERAEVACIWHAEANKGEIIDIATRQRLRCSASGLSSRRKPSPGTSPRHAIQFVGVRV
jgi:hypothetical protein